MEKMESFYQDVRSEELDNGLRIIYKYFPGEIVGISIFVDAGSGDEGKFIGSGIAHLTEHLVFEGRKDLEEQLRKLGAISNAYTTFDHTLYHLEVPKKNLKKALEIFIPAIFKPSLTEEVFKREREVVLKEEKFRDDNPGSLLIKIGFEKSYINHPYKYPILGESNLLKKLNLFDLIKFHNLKYVPNNSVIAISGSCDYTQVKEMIASLTSDISPSPILKEDFPPEEKNFSSEYSQAYPGSLVYIFISFLGVSIFDKDSPALDILSDYLSWGKDAPLYEKFVKTGICYNVSSFNYTPYSQGIFGFTAVLERNKVELFKKELRKFLQEIKNSGFDRMRIERLKKKAVFEFLKSQETPLGCAQLLSRDQGLTGDYKFGLMYIERLLKLDENALKIVAQKYLNLNSFTEVRLQPQEKREAELRHIKNEREYKKVVYPNKLRLILAKNKFSPLTAITLLFQGGVRVEDEKTNGISQILPRVLITAELERKIEDLGGRIRPVSGNNSFGFEVEVIQSNIEDALKVLSEIVLNPVFESSELEVQKNIQLGRIRDSEIDLFYQAFKLLRESLYKRHPYRMMPEGTLESISALKMEDLKKFASRFFVPNNCVISIAGDIGLKEVEKEVKRLFSRWKEKKLDINPGRDVYPEKKLFVSKNIPQKEAVVEMGFMVPEITSQERYCLDIIQTLVSGQGSLFFNKIRRAIGAAYTLGGTSFLGPDPGVLCFYVATTPEKKAEVIEKMQEILKDLANGNIEDAEITDAREMIRTRFYRDTITNSALSFWLAVEEIVGIGYQEIDKYLQGINSVSKKDLVEFIDKYINPEKASVVEVGNI